jgi:UDP-N-acetylmuramate dehydrogenase
MNARLADHTTLGLGGPAARMIVLDRTSELVDAVRDHDRRAAPLMVLGGGTNVVIADEGFDGTVIKLSTSEVRVDSDGDRVVVSAEAGARWDDVVARAASEGWSGIEALSGIPGSVGATPMQNVGAYGQEVSDVIRRVRVLDRGAGTLVWIDAADCGFGYRTSRFRGRADRIVVEVEMVLARSPLGGPVRYAELARALGVAEGGAAPLARVRETVIALRRAKGMVLDSNDPESRSAGSFFTNPLVEPGVVERVEAASGARPPAFPASEGRSKLAAAWLIERSGFSKGQRFGRVHVSSKHALALVTEPGATTADLLNAARAIQSGVRDRFGITLEPEPIFVGCAL